MKFRVYLNAACAKKMLWETNLTSLTATKGWCVSKTCKFTKFCIFKIYRNFVCWSILQTRSIANIKWRKNVHHLCIWKWPLPWWKGFCKVHLWILQLPSQMIVLLREVVEKNLREQSQSLSHFYSCSDALKARAKYHNSQREWWWVWMDRRRRRSNVKLLR